MNAQSVAQFVATLARVARRGQFAILTYHRVLADSDPLLPDEPDARSFDWQMQVLSRHFRPLTIRDATERLAAGSVPARTVCVTFDDGYANNALVALPILQRWRVPATFFIATGFLDGGRMFNDTVIEAVRRHRGDVLEAPWLKLPALRIGSLAERRAAIEAVIEAIKYRPQAERTELAGRLAAEASVALPTDLMMTRTQVRTLAASGMLLGAHTRSHPILAQLEPGDARAEIAEGKAELEAIVGEKVDVFAYPNGRPFRDYHPQHVAFVKDAGFCLAASTHRGCVTQRSDPWQLPRIGPPRGGPGEFALRLAREFFSPAADPPAHQQ